MIKYCTAQLSGTVLEVDSIKVVRCRKVALCCFSSDCKNFSKGKGKIPLNNTIRFKW